MLDTDDEARAGTQMTLSPGDDWGTPGLLPADAPVATSDRRLAELVGIARPQRPDVVALADGDLCRTLGGRGDVAKRLGTEATLAPIDAAVASLDGHDAGPFVAHLVARGPRWSGPFLVVMNAEWLGPWQMAPRAHPGDGLLDIVLGSLSARERLIARRRARTGAHLPHPQLSMSRRDGFEHAFSEPRRVYLDGMFRGIVFDNRRFGCSKRRAGIGVVRAAGRGTIERSPKT